jgi:aminoglycoside 6'-N-acetyltransferase I
MEIRTLMKHQKQMITGAAALLVENFPHSWASPAEALQEVRKSLRPGKIALVAVDKDEVVGYIGAMPGYGVTAWELHPLVVRKTRQRQGVGTMLVRALEDKVSSRGCVTLFLGSDDEFGQTSLSGVDLYDHLWERIQNIQNIKNHPYAFYQKLGYQITGVIPDANGPGKPDIWLARRINAAN